MDQQVPTTPLSPLPSVTKKSFLSRYKFTLLSALIVVLALVPLVVLSKTAHSPVSQPIAQKVTVTPTPTVLPMTEQNAVPTIDATQNPINDAMTQANQDLQSSGSVNASQDSVSGL